MRWIYGLRSATMQDVVVVTALGVRRMPADRQLRKLDAWHWAPVACVAVLVVGILTGVLATGPVAGPGVRARSYLARTACLLTDSRGLAGPQAAAAWAGLQDASAATGAQVQYLAVPSGTTAAGARPYLASLVLRKCAVVVATGPAQVAAVAADAVRFGSVRFAVAGGRAPGANVAVLPASAGAMRSAVTSLVTSAVSASG